MTAKEYFKNIKYVGDICRIKQRKLEEMESSTVYVSPIISDVARQASSSAIETLPDTPIDVVSLWRSGNFINLSGWVPYTGSRFGLLFVVDESTLDANTVVARIVYDVMGATPTFERRVYASFDIRNVWSRQSCHTLRVLAGNGTYEFSK